MKIKVTLKQRYGQTDIVIVDPQIHNTVSVLTKRKTVYPSDLQALQALGHEIEKSEYMLDSEAGRLG